MDTLAFLNQVKIIKIGGGLLPDALAYGKIAESLAQHQRATGAHLVVPISAAKGVTDMRIAESKRLFPDNPWQQAEYIAQGEIESAALLTARLREIGVVVQMITAKDIGLEAWAGDDPFNAHFSRVNAGNLIHLAWQTSITVMAGYFGLDRGRIVLLGRDATDLIAVILAGALGVPCDLCKESGAIFALDPNMVPGRLPLLVSRLSHYQSFLFAESGHQFVMAGCLRLAERLDVTIRLLPNPTAKDAWQVKAVIGQEPATSGLLVGVKKDSHLDGIPSACVTVIELGEPRLNGQLKRITETINPAAVVRVQDNQTKIYLSPEAVAPLVGALAKELGLLAP